MKEFVVSAREAGMKLLPFLRDKCADFAPSVKALKRAIDTGGCRVNGKVETFSTYPLQKGQRVRVNLEHAEKKVVAKPTILLEDDALLICNKPAGFLSDNTAFNRAFPEYKGKLELVHRLDKDTSGVILLAKTSVMKGALEALFEERQIYKAYLALVDGKVKSLHGKIDNFLAQKQSYEGQSIWGAAKTGRRAITLWKVLKAGEKASVVFCEPLTGRTHQIRVHLAGMGHPILGDRQYGKKFLCSLEPARHLLHAYKLCFVHPVTQAEVEVTASLPDDFSLALTHLKLKVIEI